MQIARCLLAFSLMTYVSVAVGANGLVVLPSPYSVDQTMQRLEQEVAKRDLNVFARIDHAAGAARAGAELRPTVLLVFGNPKGGTPFMQCQQTIAIDLPLKVLVWEDARRHGATDCPIAGKLAKALDDIARATVAE